MLSLTGAVNKMIEHLTQIANPGPVFLAPQAVAMLPLLQGFAKGILDTATTPVDGLLLPVTWVPGQSPVPGAQGQSSGPPSGMTVAAFKQAALDILTHESPAGTPPPPYKEIAWDTAHAPYLEQLLWGFWGAMQYVLDNMGPGDVVDPTPMSDTGSVLPGTAIFDHELCYANVESALQSLGVGVVVLGVHVKTLEEPYIDPLTERPQYVGQLFGTTDKLARAISWGVRASLLLTTIPVTAPGSGLPGAGGVSPLAFFIPYSP